MSKLSSHDASNFPVGLLLPAHAQRFGSAEPVERPALEMPGAKFGGTFRRMLHDNPSTLDPTFVTISKPHRRPQMFDGLVPIRCPPQGPIPAIAEFWEASGWPHLDFTLRQGVTFHNGREVTAHDFVYSFTRLLELKSRA